MIWDIVNSQPDMTLQELCLELEQKGEGTSPSNIGP